MKYTIMFVLFFHGIMHSQVTSIWYSSSKMTCYVSEAEPKRIKKMLYKNSAESLIQYGDSLRMAAIDSKSRKEHYGGSIYTDFKNLVQYQVLSSHKSRVIEFKVTYFDSLGLLSHEFSFFDLKQKENNNWHTTFDINCFFIKDTIRATFLIDSIISNCKLPLSMYSALNKARHQFNAYTSIEWKRSIDGTFKMLSENADMSVDTLNFEDYSSSTKDYPSVYVYNNLSIAYVFDNARCLIMQIDDDQQVTYHYDERGMLSRKVLIGGAHLHDLLLEYWREDAQFNAMNFCWACLPINRVRYVHSTWDEEEFNY